MKFTPFSYIFTAIIVFFAIALSLFHHIEYSSDVWGYWFFARVFAETGKFIVIDRSPLYILYLNLFRMLPHPYSLVLEYFVTTFIVVTSLIVFFKFYMGLIYSVFISIVWIPFMQVAEPPVQKLALACSLWAFIIRKKQSKRFYVAISYVFLVAAYLFRSIYFYYFVFFIIWDFITLFRIHKYNVIQHFKPQLRSDWPLGLVLILYIFIIVMQSPHPWNNVWFASTKWFPADGKHFTIHQPFNILYTREKYGPDFGHDFYFTNQEVFHGASDTLGAIRANPQFMIRQTILNIKKSIPIIANTTLLPLGIMNLPYKDFFDISIIGVILFGVFKSSKERLMFPFLAANLTLLIIVILMVIHRRYLFPLIPILSLSGWWYGIGIYRFLTGLFKNMNSILLLILRPFFFIIPGLSLILFTMSADNYDFSSENLWLETLTTFINDVNNNDLKMLTNRSDNYVISLSRSQQEIVMRIKDCKGIMSYESLYIAAFSDIPISRFYDIWEIPPFGQLGDPVYKGLIPDRVDCVLVSYDLERALGAGTNAQMRYEGYIKPYVQQLLNAGALRYNVENYGNIYSLDHKSKV